MKSLSSKSRIDFPSLYNTSRFSSSENHTLKKKFEDLLNRVSKNSKHKRSKNLKIEQETLARATAWAIDKHGDQKRLSGDPFVYHPIEVAKILAENELGLTTVIAGLFHDIVEDCPVSIEEIAEWEQPGIDSKEIAKLVDGVTKVTEVARIGEKRKRDIATYQKIIIATASDARVLLIKLADRLHNLRTIQYLPIERQKKVCSETLDIYTPLSHRIGMTAIKAELEDRALAVLHPQAYEATSLIISDAHKKGDKALAKISKKIKSELRKNKIDFISVKSRVKSRYSIAEKLERRDLKEYQLEDIFGMRIIVSTKDECYRTLGIVHSLYHPRSESFDDYIATPRPNLYQSLHTAVIVPFNQSQEILEVQIRTEEMDDIAERGVAAHWNYKAKVAKDSQQDSLMLNLKTAADNQADLFNSEVDDSISEAFENLKRDLFTEEIYCFTPAGDIKILPVGSNPIDFAYSVHSDVGDKIVGARVNGDLVPLAKPLHNSDIVEVITSDKSTPSLDWLNSVQTNRAKNKIRAWHAAGPHPEHKRQILNSLRASFREHNLLREASYSEEQIIRMMQDALPKELEGLSHDQIIEKFKNEKQRNALVEKFRIEREAEKEKSRLSAPKAKPPKQRVKERSRDIPKILIDGSADIQYKIAGCCHPEPGDKIVGYISQRQGGGIIIHSQKCPNVLRQPKELLIQATYGTEEDVIFNSRIELKLRDRPGLLSDVTQAVYESGCEIVNVELRSQLGIVKGYLLCKISGSKSGKLLRNNLKAVEGFLEMS